jgi:aromatic ring-opening dioxygenase catalytic subunit (LigB family)
MAYSENNSKGLRAPSLFISHGTGPMPLLDSDQESYRQLLRGHGKLLDGVKAIILVSAHWETDEPHITSASDPGLFYDYEHMRDILPREAFEFKYPARADPQLAAEVAHHLTSVGFHPVIDSERGLDHAVYVPMTLMRPNADIPIVQMSILKGENERESTEKNIKLGEALAGFRERGYAICGSGGSYHDFHVIARALFENQPVPPSASVFEKFLETSATVSDAAERRSLLLGWRDFPESFIAHKKGESDHFMPFLVAAASGGDQSGERYDMYNYKGAPMSFYRW